MDKIRTWAAGDSPGGSVAPPHRDGCFAVAGDGCAVVAGVVGNIFDSSPAPIGALKDFRTRAL